MGLASLDIKPQYNQVIVQTMYLCEILTTYIYLLDKSFLSFIRLFDLTVIGDFQTILKFNLASP